MASSPHLLNLLSLLTIKYGINFCLLLAKIFASTFEQLADGRKITKRELQSKLVQVQLAPSRYISNLKSKPNILYISDVCRRTRNLRSTYHG